MSGAVQQTRRVEYDGYSLTDLKVGMEPTIDVIIPSLSPGALGGPVASGTTPRVTSFFDHSGAEQTATVTSANHVKAEWYGRSNERYAPLVKKKEQVKVFQLGNSDKFYWEELGRDSRLRTLDRHREEYSATPVVGKPNTDDNTYFREVNAVDGYWRIKTSKANKEPYAYVINIDTKNGAITIADDKAGEHGANKFFMDSANNIMHFSNNDGTTYHAEKRNLTVEVPDTFTIKAGKQIYFESPVYTFNQTQTGTMVINLDYITLNGKTMVGNFSTIGYNVGSMKINGPLVTGGIRSPSYVNGPIGDGFKPSTTDPRNVEHKSVDNAPDTNVSGDGDRHSAAYENVLAAFEATASAIEQVASAVPTSADVSGIISNARASIMNALKGV